MFLGKNAPYSGLESMGLTRDAHQMRVAINQIRSQFLHLSRARLGFHLNQLMTIFALDHWLPASIMYLNEVSVHFSQAILFHSR